LFQAERFLPGLELNAADLKELPGFFNLAKYLSRIVELFVDGP